MSEIKRMSVRLTFNDQQYRHAVQQSEHATKQFSRTVEGQVDKAEKKWTAFSGKTKLVLGAVSAAMASIPLAASRMIMSYDQALTNAISVTGKFGEAARQAYQEANELARKIGRETKYSTQEAAQAMYDLASKGFDVTEWAKTLPGIVNFAAATMGDLASTTELVTSTLNQFNLAKEESIRVADVFTYAISHSAATQSKLGESMKYVGPVAAALNVSLEETVAILGKLYDAGYDGSMAGTALRMAMVELTNPTGEVADRLKKWNINAEEMAKYGFTEMIRRMMEAGATAADFADVFGVRAGPAMLSFRQFVEESERGVYALWRQLEQAGGTAQRIAEAQLSTAHGQWEELKSTAEEVMISIGSIVLPGLRWAFSAMIGPINRVADLIGSFGAAVKKVPREVWLFLGAGAVSLAGARVLQAVSGHLANLVASMRSLATSAGLTRILSFLGITPVSAPILGVLATLTGLFLLAYRRARDLAAAYDDSEESAKKLADSLSLAYTPFEKQEAKIEQAQDTLATFVRNNWNLIEQLRKLSRSGAQAFALEVAYQLRLGGTDAKKAIEAVNKALLEAGKPIIEVGMVPDLDSLQDFVEYLPQRVADMLAPYKEELAKSGVIVWTPPKSVEEDIRGLADLLARAFSEDKLSASVGGLATLEEELRKAGLGANDVSLIMEDALNRFLEMTGLAKYVGDDFDTVAEAMEAIEKKAPSTTLQRLAHIYLLCHRNGYTAAQTMDLLQREFERLEGPAKTAENAMAGLVQQSQLSEEELQKLQEAYEEFAKALDISDPVQIWEELMEEAEKAAREAAEEAAKAAGKGRDAWQRFYKEQIPSLDDYIQKLKEKHEEEDKWIENLKTLRERYDLDDALLKAVIEIGPKFAEELVKRVPEKGREILDELAIEIEREGANYGEKIYNAITGKAKDTGEDFTEDFDKASGLTRLMERRLGEVDYYGIGQTAGRDLRSGIEKGFGTQPLSITISPTYPYRGLMEEGEGGAAPIQRAAFLDLADNYLGVPYVWGGESPKGWDCSGFVYYILKKLGIHAPRTAAGMQAYFPRASAPLPGDLLFYGTPAHHVAIYYGNGMQLEARGRKWGTGIFPVRKYSSVGRVALYDAGGVLPPGITIAANLTGAPEVIVPASLTKAIYDLVTELKRQFKGNALAEAVADAFRKRMDVQESYLERERTRVTTWQAMGVDETVIAQNIRDHYLRILDNAIAEAAAQLEAAKAAGVSPEVVNELTIQLWELQAEAAEARQEMEWLSRVPLERAADRWATAFSQLETVFNLLGDSSVGLAGQLQLLPSMLGSLGGRYQSMLDLMSMATTPEDIMGYGSEAISALSTMYATEKSVIERALSDTLESIDDAERRWEEAWEARSSAVEKATEQQAEALEQQLEDLERSQERELRALEDYYAQKLALLEDRERAITREQQRNRAIREIGELEEELRILRGQGYYTEADIARMRELETRLQEQRDQLQQQEEAWKREDERRRLEQERDAALERLRQQQEMERIALQDQIEAARRALEAQQEALRQQYEQQQRFFEQQREAARQAAQREIDALVQKYAQMMQTVIDQQNKLLNQAFNYHNAGYVLGQQFAQGLIDALPLIQQAAQAAAQTAANYLQLHSPAKLGPLAELDRWLEPLPELLAVPLKRADLSAWAEEFAGTTRNVFHHDRVDIYLHADGPEAAKMDLDLLAKKLATIMERNAHGRSFNFN